MKFAKAKKQGFYGGAFVDKDEVFPIDDENGVPAWAEETDESAAEREQRDSEFRKLAMSAGQAQNLGSDVPIFRGEELPANHPQIGEAASDPVEAALDQQGIVVKPAADPEPKGPFPADESSRDSASLVEVKSEDEVAKPAPEGSKSVSEPVKVDKPDQKQPEAKRRGRPPKVKDDGADLV